MHSLGGLADPEVSRAHATPARISARLQETSTLLALPIELVELLVRPKNFGAGLATSSDQSVVTEV